MTDDLAAFLRARLDETTRKARAAKAGPWHADGDSVCATHPTDRVVDFAYDDSADHIAEHDPARVLREVEAKLGLLDLYDNPETSDAMPASFNRFVAGTMRNALAEVFRRLAAVYADHPDYREEWRP